MDRGAFEEVGKSATWLDDEIKSKKESEKHDDVNKGNNGVTWAVIADFGTAAADRRHR
jgi:hypothetical protein